jgi:hypothetical protein
MLEIWTCGCNLPISDVGVCVRLWMVVDVTGSGIAFGIAGHDLIVLWLVDTDVVYPHGGWKVVRLNFVDVDGRKTVRHSEVGNDGHRLFRNHSLANVAVGSCRFLLHCPRLFITNVPRNEAIVASLVFERVLLIRLAVVPVVVQVGQAGNGLLEGSTLV